MATPVDPNISAPDATTKAINAQMYAAAQMIRTAAHILREAKGELSRARGSGDPGRADNFRGWTDADYKRFNERSDRMRVAALDELARELEAEA